MRKISLIFLFFLLPVTAQAKKILIISDPQYGWFGRRDCQEERRNFQKIIELANSGFDSLMVLGDLADSYPKTAWRRKHQVNLFLEDLKKIKIPIFLVAGNHDLGEFPTQETIKKFKEEFGFPSWHAFWFSGYKFLVINTTLLKNRKRLPRLYAEQMDFIRANRDAKFVLGHHPPFHKKFHEINGYFNWPKDAWREISPLFQKGTFFFAGHTHRRYQLLIQGYLINNVGTCCAPWKNGVKSYGILKINGQDIRYEVKVLR